MTDRELYPDGYYSFTDSAGKVVANGRSYYPAAINVHMDRYQVLQVLRQIANYLGDGREKSEPLILSFSGTIERIEP